MKRILTTLLALGLASSAAFADIAVYKGNVVTKGLAGDQSGNGVVSAYVVIDLSTGQTQTVNHFKFFGLIKRYEVGPLVPTTKGVVEAKNGKTNTVFAYANTTNPEGVTLIQSGQLSGADSQVNIAGSAKIALPKTLKGNAFRLAIENDATTDANVLVTATSVLQLDLKASKAANDAVPAQTLSETVAALVQQLEDKGYDSLQAD